MSSSLLQTKLYIPLTRADHVPRPRLIERLNEGLWQNGGSARKLTLISAPAGFGKTTMASEWVTSCWQPIAWLSLDEGDNDLNRFLAYLVISESAVVGWLLGIWGEVLAELNDLDRAIDQAKEGIKLTARGGDVFYEVTSNLKLVRVLFSRGDITGVEDVIQAMENTAREHDMPLWALCQLLAWQGRLWLAQGKLAVAAQWVGEQALDPDGALTYPHEAKYIVCARILMAQGRLDEATTLLQRLLEAAEAGGRTSSVIEILMLQALVIEAGDGITQAITTLEKALTLAEPNGFIRIFVDEGPLSKPPLDNSPLFRYNI